MATYGYSRPSLRTNNRIILNPPTSNEEGPELPPSRQAPLLVGLSAALLVVAIVDVPWTAFLDHPHWNSIGWIPFVSPPVRPIDIAGNVALFIPFGFFAARLASRLAVAPWAVVIAGAALSAGCEFLQIYTHVRFSSATDVVSNVAGTAVGVCIARRREPAGASPV